MSDREEFERMVSGPPYEKDISRWPDDSAKYAWFGQYKELDVQLAWEFFENARNRDPAVAVVCDGYDIRWIGSGPIAPIIENSGVKVGSKLYAK